MASDPDPSSLAVPGLQPASGPPDPSLEPPTSLPTPPASPATSSAVSHPPNQVASVQDTIHASLDPTFQYIVDDIIRLSQTSVIHHQDEIYEILDLITMSPSDISDITGRINGEEVKISKRDARLLLHFVWWHQDISSRRLDTTLDYDEWFNYDRDDFTKFRHEKVPALAAGGDIRNKQNLQLIYAR